MRCDMTIVACATASDCPAGWTCEANPEGGVCSGGAGPDGAPEETVCTTPDPAQICMPPYWDLGYGGIGRDEQASGGSGEGPGAPTVGGTPLPDSPEDPNTDGDEPGGFQGEGDDIANTSSDSGGCTVSHAHRPSGAAAFLLGLAGLAALSRRRR
jgi:MYXO-CTERM domain-containing protein